MRRHPKRFAEQPRDPRARRVVLATQKTKTEYLLELECGHWALRRYRLGAPATIICVDCPANGGIGGRYFEKMRKPTD